VIGMRRRRALSAKLMSISGVANAHRRVRNNPYLLRKSITALK